MTHCTENLLCPSNNSSFVHGFYRARYWFIRHTTCPIPFLPARFPVIGGRSLLEILLIMLFIAVTAYVGATTDAESLGSLASSLGAIAVVLGFRNNILTLVFTVSFERALFWHKLISILFIALGVTHGCEYLVNESFSSEVELFSTGLALMILMILTALSYLLKYAKFEAFYFLHVLLLPAIVGAAFAHGAAGLGVGGAVWGVDLLLRYVLCKHKVSAKLQALPGNVVKISFPKTFKFKYSAGQYCFLMIPQISLYQFHPFSISSSPDQDIVTFHARVLGDWTGALQALVRGPANCSINKKDGEETGVDRQDTKKSNEVAVVTYPEVAMDIHVEGPFGILSVDIDSPIYQVLLIVVGGIGVTHGHSLFMHAVHSHVSKIKTIRKVVFVWSVREPDMVEQVTSTFGEEVILNSNATADSVGEGKKMTSRKPSKKGKARLVGPSAEDKDENCEHVEMGNRDGLEDDLHSEAPFHCEFYVTSACSEDDITKLVHPSVAPVARPFLRSGRPSLPKLFSRVAKLCIDEGVGRVAVLSCGPAVIINEVHDLCVNRSLRGGCGVQFDLHKEEFDF
eukprot:GDKJ01004485.1.p1 GENE.GDKJ01004485.1~~GDKJ01004485.1.p1  ORF type:complete len:568 (-),score=40.25 GDKJ01004485.1:1338-3041(-)